jgi:hypothetical protein
MMDFPSADRPGERAPWEAPRLTPLGIGGTLKMISPTEMTVSTGPTTTVGPS